METQGRGDTREGASGDVPETNVGNIGWRDRKPLSRMGRGQIGALVVSG